jgi:hypothetical protein
MHVSSISRVIKFRFIWQNSCREENLKKIGKSETRIACGGHVCKWIGTKREFFIEDLP